VSHVLLLQLSHCNRAAGARLLLLLRMRSCLSSTSCSSCLELVKCELPAHDRWLHLLLLWLLLLGRGLLSSKQARVWRCRVLLLLLLLLLLH
jgi:hypothetical protein